MYGDGIAAMKLCVLFCFVCLVLTPKTIDGKYVNLAENTDEGVLHRIRRQFDLTVSADHDDKADETEIALEAIANLWRSQDGATQVEGSAKVIHRSNSLESGNTRYSARLHVHHDYKQK